MKRRKVRKATNKNAYALVTDVVIIALGIVVAIFLSKIGFIDAIVNSVKGYYIIASFLTGIFFTSVFTLAPASIALVHLAEDTPIHNVVVWGGLGAMCGDLILFFFIRDRFAEDLMKTIRKSTVKHIMKSLHFGFLRWLSPILGALIIASPLPDEFGIALLGMSKTKTIFLIPISFLMNMLGIFLLIEFAHLF